MRTLGLFVALGFVIGCGSSDDMVANGGQDLGVALDAGSMPDASTGADPLNAAPTCTSNHRWLLGNLGLATMNPGLACIACHQTEPRAPRFSAAGTVYPTGHEPDLCEAPATITNATIVITDASGGTVTLNPNGVGNFYYEGSLALPITAEVHYQGRTRAMITPAPSGDCNSCHTQDGAMAAPGRITLP
jgi:hypothetical protein